VINIANTSETQQKYKQIEELVSQFQQKFRIDKLRSMTLEEHMVGHRDAQGDVNKDYFC
jgi:hypothetical protein